MHTRSQKGYHYSTHPQGNALAWLCIAESMETCCHLINAQLKRNSQEWDWLGSQPAAALWHLGSAYKTGVVLCSDLRLWQPTCRFLGKYPNIDMAKWVSRERNANHALTASPFSLACCNSGCSFRSWERNFFITVGNLNKGRWKHYEVMECSKTYLWFSGRQKTLIRASTAVSKKLSLFNASKTSRMRGSASISGRPMSCVQLEKHRRHCSYIGATCRVAWAYSVKRDCSRGRTVTGRERVGEGDIWHLLTLNCHANHSLLTLTKSTVHDCNLKSRKKKLW